MYTVDSPISTNGKITPTPVQLSEGSIKFAIDLKESNKEDVVCSIQNGNEWERLSQCSVTQDTRDDQIVCCSTQFGVFSAVSKDYYAAMEKSKTSQTLISLLPSFSVLVLLIFGVLQLSFKRINSGNLVDQSSKEVENQVSQNNAT